MNGEMTKERVAYLKGLADEYGVSYKTVEMLADMLGPSEDHDGLISTLDDIEWLGLEL